MASCKDCIHDRVCPHLKDSDAEKCGAFKNKANFVELPCKIGDIVYGLTFGEVNAYVVEKMKFKYTPDGLECEEVKAMGKFGLMFNFDNIGKTVFRTREEAEAKLKGGAE